MHSISPPRDFDPGLIERAVILARALQARASALQTPSERRQQAELDRMLQSPADKVTLVQLTDQAFRCRSPARVAEHLTHILDLQGIPRFFNPLDRAMLRGFQAFGSWLPGVAVPLVREHMHSETANVVLPAEPDLLRDHLLARQRGGTRMNLNLLGEAVLGEEEALRRLERNLQILQRPEVEVISVKISTLYSQISPLGRAATLRVVGDRLERLYREAAHLRFQRAGGELVPKFIYLDMEEYRDLHLTAETFMRTLERRGLEDVRAGMALQAYLPDSASVQQEINAWARGRIAAGGAPVTLRIVKGANLEAERIEACHRDWPQAPFPTKRETDANFHRMLEAALRPENLEAVRVGVATHNLFDLAYGLVLAEARDAGNRVQFEMLEGMANHQRRALLEQTREVLLYAPACLREEFLNALGYLMRRLDENTGPDNFLRHAFRLHVDSPEWQRLEGGFRESFSIEIPDGPRRTQNRLEERHDHPRPPMPLGDFANEPDTDWSLPSNAAWAEHVVARHAGTIGSIPLVVRGEERPGAYRQAADAQDAHDLGCCRDPSRPGIVLARYEQAGAPDIDDAVECAHVDPEGWRSASADARSAVLGRVALEIRRARARLLRAALANGGKTLAESDPEVSEAIDFVECYRASASELLEACRPSQVVGRGVAVVVTPWNFPIAIPCGGVAAALAAGSTVILKPASDAVLVAWELCQCFWRAGVPRTVLQFLPCPGGDLAQRLATHGKVDAVILTGGTATAHRLLEARPGIHLLAETGGKNATVITAMSDRELAIKCVVQSAFSHSGQKCSATSLLLLEAEVYDDPAFKRTLVDAVQSLPVGSAWDLSTRMGPLIRPPAGALETALKTLDPGESWALLPHPMGDNPNLWTPGVKFGVQPGSLTHVTELFGPLLGVMRFERLEEAIDLVNRSGYGLTSGLHSLDEREHAIWMAGVRAGNLYINRGTTGAIVLRQPFGGHGRSCFGPGLKAGGPNYLAPLVRLVRSQKPRPRATRSNDAPGGPDARSPGGPVTEALASWLRGLEDGFSDGPRDRVLNALASFEHEWRAEFGREHDPFRLLGQDNVRRYLRFREIRVRVSPRDDAFDLLGRIGAARVTGARVVVSRPAELKFPLLQQLEAWPDAGAAGIECLVETDEQLAETLRAEPPHPGRRVRYAGSDRVPDVVRRAAVEAGVFLADEAVCDIGRLELLWYLQEQSVSTDYHRYGNLGARAGERRREPA